MITPFTRFLAALLIALTVFVSNPALPIFAEGEEAPVVTETVATPAPGENGESTPNAGTPSDTGDGTDGNSGGSASGDTVVVTGDAASIADTTTTANTNETGVEQTSPETEETPLPEGATEVESTTTVTVENENTATAENATEVGADTGNNEASAGGGNSYSSGGQGATTPESTGGNAYIETGNAYAAANVVNVINTNIFNSQGFFVFLNSFFGGGTLDLSDLNFFDAPELPTGGTYCSLGGCGSDGASYVMLSNNTATIDNQVVVRANTGGNTASGENAYVSTGNAYAAANVVNVANTNFVDSNYLLLSFNSFGNMNGDIVLPNSNFFSQFFGGSVGSGSSVSVSNTNGANVTNTIGVTADSGNNSATANGGDAVVVSGDATALSGATNVINTNALGGTSVFLLFRVFGNWAGDVFNAPEGIEWAPTANGIALFSENGQGGNPLETLTVSNGNYASINNNINVYALTGDNRVEAGEGEAVVQTGDAYAAANVVNVANTNVVGRNWIFAIFNIFGDWNGSLSFGRPDLWVGAVAETPSGTGPGAPVIYHFTVKNQGDADAHNVILETDFNPAHLLFGGASDISIGTLAKGETKEFTLSGTITGSLTVGDTPIPLLATLTLDESDANTVDNSEEVTIVGQFYPTGNVGAVRPGTETPDPIWKIKKTVSSGMTTASSTVDYTIVIQNDGGPAYNATLFDSVTDENGDTIFEQSWDLGTVLPSEEITVTYSVFFHSNIPEGAYTNHAFVRAQGRSSLSQYAVSKDSPVASATVVITGEVTSGENQPVVALNIDEPSCGQYLYESIKTGGDNNPVEVKKLQKFLSTFAGFVTVKETGSYDSETERAVREFQKSHGEEVLGPWGLEGATGYVYITTRKKINDIYCQGAVDFPLSEGEVTEISGYKKYLADLRAKRAEGASIARGAERGLFGDIGLRNDATAPTTPTPGEGVGESATTVERILSMATGSVQASVAGASEALGSIRKWLGSLAGTLGNLILSRQSDPLGVK